MNDLEAMEKRHSVRVYTIKPIESEKRNQLNELIRKSNCDSGLHFRIRYDDTKGFDSKLAHYGQFQNVRNYIIVAGIPEKGWKERCGYYGERIVLEAQKLGLNTCWVALAFKKSAVRSLLQADEKLAAVIAIGYGENQGVRHHGKTASQVMHLTTPAPEWFLKGVEAALLAPTALNQQKFVFTLQGSAPVIEKSGIGPYTELDLGIVKYHFEAASGHMVKKKS